jgi:hypothetical protein
VKEELVQTAVGYVHGMRKTAEEDPYLAITKSLLFFFYSTLSPSLRATTATCLQLRITLVAQLDLRKANSALRNGRL